MHLSGFLPFLPFAAAQHFASTAPASDLHNLNLTTITTFPQVPKINSHIRILNGAPVPALVSLTNNEPFTITINFISASLWTSEGGESLKNFTIKKINKKVKPAQKYDVHYALQTDLKEQEALLNINLVAPKPAAKSRYKKSLHTLSDTARSRRVEKKHTPEDPTS